MNNIKNILAPEGLIGINFGTQISELKTDSVLHLKELFPDVCLIPTEDINSLILCFKSNVPEVIKKSGKRELEERLLKISNESKNVEKYEISNLLSNINYF